MATLKDIAKKTNLNVSTVSRALSGSANISDATKRKVQEAAEELGYKPNVSAKILAGKGSRMIGIIVPEIDSNYFAKLICFVEENLRAKGYSLIIANTQYDAQKEANIIGTFCDYNVEGIFLASSIHMENKKALQHIKDEYKVSVVLLEALAHYADYDYVMIDDTYGMVEAIRHFIDKGHKKIGFISDYIIDQIRLSMFWEALKVCGLSKHEHPALSHPSSRFEIAGYEVMKNFLALEKPPTAYLAGYDDLAIGAIRAIGEYGLRIPEDIAIIGNDNIRESPYLHKALSTLAPPVEQMAELGVELLLNSIERKNRAITHHIILKPDLLLRETT